MEQRSNNGTHLTLAIRCFGTANGRTDALLCKRLFCLVYFIQFAIWINGMIFFCKPLHGFRKILCTDGLCQRFL